MAQYWLMKLPYEVNQAWRSAIDDEKNSATTTAAAAAAAASSSTPSRKRKRLGNIVIDNSTNPPTARLKLDLRGAAKVDTYLLNLNPAPKDVFVFSEHDTCRIEAPVNLSIDTRSESASSLSYREQVKARFQQQFGRKAKVQIATIDINDVPATKAERTIMDADGKTVITTAAAITPGVTSRTGRGVSGDSKREVIKDRRYQLSRPEVQEKLHSFFQKRPYGSFKDLQSATNQPTTYLKQILKGMCDYHQTGEYQFKYSLKQDYQ
jgi:TFIIF, beta subunit HTH domain/TFIIF, beta subunit N-terminus